MTNLPSFMRHAAFFSPEDSGNTPLNIVGVGATGSWVAVIAAKMGWTHFNIWDADTVESHNVPNQAYSSQHIGMLKVDALKDVLTQINPGVKVTSHPYHWTTENSPEFEGALFIAVDSLNTRKAIYSTLQDAIDLDIIFETRIGFTMATMNILDPFDTDSIMNMMESIKDDSEVEEAPCNERIITSLVTLTASTLVHYLCSFYSSERNSTQRSYPTTTIFSLNHNNLSTYTTGITNL